MLFRSLTHCLPDNIDDHRDMLLDKFRSIVKINPAVPAPGGLVMPIPVAAE